MNLLFFIRLLLRHIWLLVALPILLVVMVFYATKDQPKIYGTSTRVYTGIATGSSIVSMESSKLDLFATNAAFDNLINIIRLRTTMEEVGIGLLAQHLMLEKPDPAIISAKSYRSLMEIVPQKVKDLVVKDDVEATIKNLNDFKNSSYDNFIYELLNYDHPHYSSNKIEAKLRVRRVQSSDLIELIYESSDPGICKGTLDILCERFIHNYTNIKVNQSDAVVQYFETQIALATDKLEEAENELLEFNRSNSIINYYEQTRHIAAEKELFNNKHLDIKLANAGAARVIEVLENKMSTREKQRITNQRIYDLRKELAQVNLDIAMKTFEDQTSEVNEQQLIEEIGNLRTRAFEIEQQLRTSVGEQYYIDNSTQGVPTDNVLAEWVDRVAEYESTKAQLVVAEAQNLEFDRLFESYAPLGATMKRLERKIDVAEKEYLSLLYSLGVAKLKQQNVELNSNLKIVAQPLFPIVAKPSKRKFLLAIAFMIGFFIPAFVIIVLEFLDRNIKSQVRAEQFMGLKVAAIFPNLARNSGKIDIAAVKEKSLQIIARRLILNAENKEQPKGPETNIIFSNLEGEGKTTLIMLLVKELSKIGYKVLFYTYNDVERVEGVELKKYTIDNSFHKTENLEGLLTDSGPVSTSMFDYVFIELPGIRTHSYPINLFKNTDHSFIVTRANRAWTKADKYALSDILEQCGDKKTQVWLNGVEFQQMEDVIGDLPRKRSFFRQKMKDIFQLQFFNKRSLLSKRGKRKMKKRSNRTMLWLLLVLLSVFTSLTLGRNTIARAKARKQPALVTVPEVTIKQDENAVQIQEEEHAESLAITDNDFDITAKANQKIQTQKSLVQNTEKFYVVGGSFSKETNAQEYQEQLIELGYKPLRAKRNADLFTVLIGEFDSHQEANAILKKYLQVDPESKAWILKANPNWVIR
ncbi:SPOR domain-containing protein [uncultured Draconibacterium sp.]|uniref:SPOR domain-containing protein n=1 Tax=uncultured Draconibacterium sp. TaxID=1573823 RepID=UPI003260373F